MELRSHDGLSGREQGFNLPHGQRVYTCALEETHTFTPNLFLDFSGSLTIRAGYI